MRKEMGTTTTCNLHGNEMRKMNAKAGAPDVSLGIAEDWRKDDYGSLEEPPAGWKGPRVSRLNNILRQISKLYLSL